MLASWLFRARFIALSAILDHPLTSYDRQRLEQLVTDRSVAGQLVPMLAGGEEPQAGDVVGRAWNVLGGFLRLDPQEMEYVEAVERGELRTELLFPREPELASRIAEHPAIQWKVLNVRRHRRR